ncbi:MAG: hypothetical protein IPL54_01790 [Chitinophagaceae bacterium]|nr:hypothetical protein [Chitinophagaceae bacterium]
MNKKIKLLTVTLLATVSMAFAQNSKSTWPEMKTFHSFMSSTFHPVEEGDFAPLKAKADSLLITANLWQASAIPGDFKPAETKAALANLVNKCKALQKAVAAKQPNDKLKTLITEAHDIFHTITGECRKADD